MIIQTWGATLTQSFQNLWMGVAHIVPKLVLSVIVFVIGWIFGYLVGKGIEEIVSAIKLDQALRNIGFENYVKKAGWNLNSGKFIGALFKWFITIVFLVAALEVLGLQQVTAFLQQVVLFYLPQVIIAVLILVVAVVVATVLQKIIVASAKVGSLKAANFFGTVAKWAVMIFAFIAALYQVGVAGPFLQTLFTGVIIALSLAFGLAFGLGGQDAAKQYLSDLKSHLKD